MMESENAASRWKLLFRIGGLAAFIAAIVFRRNIGAEIMLLRTMGVLSAGPTLPPDAVVDWFVLLQSHGVMGLALLNAFDIVNYFLVGLIFLALCTALRPGSKSLMSIAAALAFCGIATYFASNQAFTMLSLSGQYAASATEADREALLSAGKAVLAVSYNAGYEGQGPYVSFFLVSLSGLLISAVMLRSGMFGKPAAVFGILANAFGLGYYVVLAVMPALIAVTISISSVFLLVWYLIIGVKLFRMAGAPS
jgi:hypothetical protein